ncbi:MAG: family 78 glycoside hydrolase catalytic domain [Thermomicrobiales bacterium]
MRTPATATRPLTAPSLFTAAAHWIWDAGEPSPRNAWRWFRRTFDLDKPAPHATIRITADIRYVAYINGTQIGHGPVRGFPTRWFVDTWEVGHLLRTNRPNVIAVHVLHFGVSTFADFRKRGGLLAEVTLADERDPIGTDGTWRVTTPAGHNPRADRLSCQLGFTEQIDARLDAADWTDPLFDDAEWAPATVFAAPGEGPWTSLVPRDIPPLQEQPVRPSRVERLAFVRPAPISAALDLRVQMSPESANHANHISYTGYLATVVRLAKAATVTLCLPGPDYRHPGINVDGTWHPFSSLDAGSQQSHSLTLPLDTGDHLVVIEVSGQDHGHTFHLLVDADDPDAVSLASPLAGGETPFATIGPVTGIAVGTPEMIFPVVDPIPDVFAKRVQQLSSAAELAALGEVVRPMPATRVGPVSLYGLAVHPRERTEAPVPATLQAIVSGNAITVPVEPGRDTEMIFDLGREFSGFIDFEVEAPAGTIVDVYGFEYLRGDHREDTLRLDNTLRYITREGRQRYTSPTRRGMRHLQLTFRNATEGSVRLHDLRVIESHFPVSGTGYFRCSDARLNEIWAMSRRTVIACMEDTYVDCPAFEQVFWVGDSYSSARFAAYLFGAEALTERCLRLVPGSAPQSPLLGSNVPSGWDSVIPNFTFFWTQACKEHWYRTGNDDFARDIWPQVQSALNAFLTHLNDDGVLEIDAWNLLDWAPIDQPNSGVVAHQNCLFVLALDAAAVLADVAGAETEAARFRGAANDLRRAINATLWSEDAGAYIDAIHADGRRSEVISVQTQLFALLADVPTGSRRARIEAVIVDRPEEWVQIGSPWMSIFLYDALADRGYTADALADARHNYGMMLDHDATTCWEVFPSSPVAGGNILTRSHCHAWSAAPAAFFPARLLGVRALAPGWKRVLVAPEPCGLTEAEGRVPLPGRGEIAVRWRIGEDGRMALEISAPADIEIEPRLPEGIEGEITIA